MEREWLFPEEEVRVAVAASMSFAETLRRLGLCPTGGNWKTLRRYVVEHGIPTDHFDPYATSRGPKARIPLEQILVERSTYSRNHLKQRLYDEGLKSRRVRALWARRAVAWTQARNDPRPRKRGPRRHRIENLRIVCPQLRGRRSTRIVDGKNRLQTRALRALPRRSSQPRYGRQQYCSRHCAIRRSAQEAVPHPSAWTVERPPYERLMRGSPNRAGRQSPGTTGCPTTRSGSGCGRYERHVTDGDVERAGLLRCDPMPAPTVVLLAAGEGTRMRSSLPKVLHPICGRPMILWPLLAARAAGAGRVVVVDNPKRLLAEHLPEGIEVAIQEQPRGTGDAVAAAADRIDPAAPVLVINGDMPLITGEAIAAVFAAHEEAGAAATLASVELDDPGGYGRVIRAADGGVERVAETKAAGDATEEELVDPRGQRRPVRVRRRRAPVRAAQPRRATTPRASCTCRTCCRCCSPPARPSRRFPLPDPDLALGVNDRVDLAHVTRIAQQRIHAAHQRAGVTIVDPASTLIDATVAIGEDTTIEPSSFLRGAIADRRALQRRAAEHADRLGARRRRRGPPLLSRRGAAPRTASTIGPFAYLRPNAVLHENAKAGTFVEIKNATHRSRLEGPAPLLRRRRRRRRGIQPRRGHDHRQLRRSPQAPHDDRRPRPDLGRHGARRARDGRRRRLHGGRLGHHRGRPARRARRRALAPDEHRGLRRARAGRNHERPKLRRSAASRRRLGLHWMASECAGTSALGRHLDQPRVRQAPHGVLGARKPGACGEDRRAAQRRPRRRHAQDVLQRRGLLPLRGVDPRRGRLPRPADLRQPGGEASTPTTP